MEQNQLQDRWTRDPPSGSGGPLDAQGLDGTQRDGRRLSLGRGYALLRSRNGDRKTEPADRVGHGSA